MIVFKLHEPGYFFKGSMIGPCKEDCDHINCYKDKKVAGKICPVCKREIGFNKEFIFEGGAGGIPVHVDCLDDDYDEDLKDKDVLWWSGGGF